LLRSLSRPLASRLSIRTNKKSTVKVLSMWVSGFVRLAFINARQLRCGQRVFGRAAVAVAFLACLKTLSAPIKKAPLRCFFYWCAWPDSNWHAIAGNRF
jgi:hypothetical protein